MKILFPGATTTAGALCGLLFLWALFKYLSQHEKSEEETHSFATSIETGNDFKDHPITVIIPTLNEYAVLAQTINHLFTSCTLHRRTAPTVIVVVAGPGPNDDDNATIEGLKLRYPTLRFESYIGPPSRGGQQNHGARLATSPILLFLHADTLLPKSWDTAILSLLTQKGGAPAIGAFSLSLPKPVSFSLQLMLWGANIRARYGRLPYGDQAYFLLSSTFNSIGGFPDVPIMEDVSLLRRIKQYSNAKVQPALAILHEQVQTSPRRWVKNGMVWNTILNQLLMTAWLCGVSPGTIYVWYYGRSPEDMARASKAKDTVG